MYDLISRKALLAEYDERHKGPPGGARELIEDAPSVTAVPLEPLCNFLAAYAAPPIRSPLATYGSLEEAWKAFLIDWMEEQDAAD